MSKEVALAVILVSLSTVLKICSVVALCGDHRHPEEPEHDHTELTFVVKKSSKRIG